MAYDSSIMSFIVDVSSSVAHRGNEVPVVAAVVLDKKIIAICSNESERSGLRWRHAELCAVERVASVVGCELLSKCDMYVTLEPCDMCRGLLALVRFANVYFSAYNHKSGMLVRSTDYCNDNILGGFRSERSSGIISEYFQSIRRVCDE